MRSDPMRLAALIVAVPLCVTAAHAAEFEWMPVSASGSSDPPVGNTITLYGGGQSVTMEVWMSGWTPKLLTTYQIALDSTGYSSGDGLSLGPLNGCCPGDPTTAFVDISHPDFVFGGMPPPCFALPAANLTSLNYQMGASIVGSCTISDVGAAKYGATLMVDVPVGAAGTYTIGFLQSATLTFMKDQSGAAILPLSLTPAVITVLCVDNADCYDGNDCTVDTCTDDVCFHTPTLPGTACGDGSDTLCTDPDTCDGSGNCQGNHAPNGIVCDDGLWCFVDETCLDGVCGGGSPRDCSDGVDCTTDQCKERFDICEHNLDAGFCVIDNVCYADGELNPTSDCEECDPTLSTTSWSPLPVDAPCGDPSTTDCSDPDTCNGTGGCLPNNSLPGTPCGDGSDTDCTDPDTCMTGVCRDNHEPDGTTCTDDGNECTDDVCASGICTHPNEPSGTACGDPGESDCDHADTCDGAGGCDDNVEPDDTPCTDDGNECTDDICISGSCTHPDHPAGTACGDDSDTDCTDPDSCDGFGSCEDNHEPDGTVCTDDGNDCTDDVCDNGGCTHPDKLEGAACGDGSDTDCTNPDTCDGAGTCEPNHEPIGWGCGDPSDTDCDNPDTCDGTGGCLDNLEPDGTVCTDDGNDCTDDVCDTGGCTHPDKAAGTACGDPSDTDCTDPDTCDGAGVCEDNHELDGTVCTDDGNDCTDDVCDTGGCTHPNKLVGAACGDPSDTDCTDPDTCDGFGLCEDNHEFDGTVCTDDGNDCTDDVCASGGCTHPNKAEGAACGNGSDTDCTDPDTCDGAGSCQDNHAPAGSACGLPDDTDCDNPDSCDGAGGCEDNLEPDGTTCTDDGNDCTNDACESGGCTHPNKPAGTACGDDSDTDCTDPDTCDGSGACEASHELDGTVCTDDGNDCTADFCVSGGCTHPNEAVGTACGDPGNTDCTNPDTCDGSGVCEDNHELDGTSCTDDGNDCTNDVCDAGGCTHPNKAEGAACGNGSDTDCTDPDTCDGAGSCQDNHAPAGSACGVPDDTDCDNPDTCDGTGGCLDNLEPDGTTCTDDGNDCTNDVCASAGCTHPNKAAGTACGDPSDTDCTDPDTCDGVGGCENNHELDGTICTDDGNDCTDDVCGTGGCTHPDKALGAACGDPSGTDCTDPDTCDGAGTCLDNHELDGTICTDDGNDCTNDVCAGGGCTHPDKAIGTACGDGSDTDCTDPDTCDGVGGCESNHEVSGTACGDPTYVECDNPDTCDGAGSCSDNLEPDGTTCTSDENDCTDDVCEGGGCTHPNKAVGAACGQGADTDCTNPDTCDGSGVCLNNHDPDGTVCTDDGNDCTEDVCDTGGCTHPDKALGEACGDPGDTDCTDPDTCDGAGTCLDNHELDETICTDDGSDCTDDRCGAGICTHPNLSAGTACGDGSDTDCTNPDSCDGSGVCLANHEPDGTTCPDDGNDCTDDVCSIGICTHPNKTTGTACGNPNDTDCDNPDTCDGAGGCRNNHEPDGTTCTEDGNDCTDDVCSGGGCTHPNKPGGAACGDPGDTDCTDPDTCDGSGSCQNNHEPDGTTCPEDGNECTNDVCQTGGCTHPNKEVGAACGQSLDTDCDNPDTCDGEGACLDNYEPAGTACGDPTDTACDHSDTCNGIGVCEDNLEPDGTSCDDDLFCNGDDTCSAGECQHSGNPCTGPCNEANDSCLCDPPIVEVAGPRYLAVSLQPPTAGPQAIVIQADCPEGVPRYVGAVEPFFIEGPTEPPAQVGLLVDDPAAAVFMTPEEWGDPVYVTGEAMAPATRYYVWGDCGVPGEPAWSNPTTVSTSMMSDVDHNLVVNFTDIQFTILGFEGNLPLIEATLASTDSAVCEPDRVLNFTDVQWAVLTFEGATDALDQCTFDCPRCFPPDCNDLDQCTLDECVEGTCQHTPLGDGSPCIGGLCCGGSCTALACSGNVDCNDGETCTIDTCSSPGTCSASCHNTWALCGPQDGCCGPTCTLANDPDCSCLPDGASCSSDDECCSEKCAGKKCR